MLREWVSKTDAVHVLAWAARHRVGHRPSLSSAAANWSRPPFITRRRRGSDLASGSTARSGATRRSIFSRRCCVSRPKRCYRGVRCGWRATASRPLLSRICNASTVRCWPSLFARPGLAREIAAGSRISLPSGRRSDRSTARPGRARAAHRGESRSDRHRSAQRNCAVRRRPRHRTSGESNRGCHRRARAGGLCRLACAGRNCAASCSSRWPSFAPRRFPAPRPRRRRCRRGRSSRRPPRRFRGCARRRSAG